MKYLIITNVDRKYIVEAETSDNAVDLVMSGDIEATDEEFMGYDVEEVTP